MLKHTTILAAALAVLASEPAPAGDLSTFGLADPVVTAPPYNCRFRAFTVAGQSKAWRQDDWDYCEIPKPRPKPGGGVKGVSENCHQDEWEDAGPDAAHGLFVTVCNGKVVDQKVRGDR